MHNFTHLYDKCKEIEVTIYKLIHLIQSFEFCTYQIYTFYKKLFYKTKVYYKIKYNTNAIPFIFNN